MPKKAAKAKKPVAPFTEWDRFLSVLSREALILNMDTGRGREARLVRADAPPAGPDNPGAFAVMSAYDLPLQDNSVDAVWAGDSLRGFPDAELRVVFGSLYRVLRPNGLAYMRFDAKRPARPGQPVAGAGWNAMGQLHALLDGGFLPADLAAAPNSIYIMARAILPGQAQPYKPYQAEHHT